MKGASLHPAAPGLDADTLATAFARALGQKDGPLKAPEAAFIAQVHRDLSAEELADASAGDLAAAFAELWRFGATLTGEAPIVRVRRWTAADGRDLGRDLLEIAQPDRPFLVDSIMGEIAEAGFPIRAFARSSFSSRRRRLPVWIRRRRAHFASRWGLRWRGR